MCEEKGQQELDNSDRNYQPLDPDGVLSGSGRTSPESPGESKCDERSECGDDNRDDRDAACQGRDEAHFKSRYKGDTTLDEHENPDNVDNTVVYGLYLSLRGHAPIVWGDARCIYWGYP